MNNNCKNCGKELDSEARFCPECGTPVNGEMLEVETTEPSSEAIKTVETTTEPSPEEIKERKKHVITIFALFGGSILCSLFRGRFFPILSVILALSSFILMISGRKKYKDFKVINVILIVTVVSIILYFLLSALVMFIFVKSCEAFFENLPTNCG